MTVRSDFERQFVRHLELHALLQPGSRVLVALSGGSDSVALLHLLLRAQGRLGVHIFAAHLDHAIRSASLDDVAFVRSLCLRLKVPLTIERRDVPTLAAESKVGLEEAGRAARRDFLLATAERLDCETIALGHHRGDQAETVIHHLLRGCGVSGLAAMRPISGRFVRPLLPFSRQELRDYLATVDENFVEDESNLDRLFTRNRIRHEVMPILSTFNPRLEEALAQLAACAAGEEGYWEIEVARLEERLARRDGERIELAVADLLALHPALRLRLLRALLTPFAAHVDKEIGYLHLAAVERLLTGVAPQSEVDLPGVWVARRYQRLLLAPMRPDPAKRGWSIAIATPGDYRLPNGLTVTVEICERPISDDPWTIAFPVEVLERSPVVRAIRPGDRMRLTGLAGRKRIKELMIEGRIPKEERQSAAVLEVDGEILWLVGLRRGGGGVTKSVGTLLHLAVKGAADREMP